MNVEFLSSSGKVNELVLRISFLNERGSRYHHKLIGLYITELKRVYRVDKIKKNIQKEKGVYLLRLVYKETFGIELIDEASILSFVSYLGFVKLYTIEELNQVEYNRLKALAVEKLNDDVRLEKIRRSKSRKVFVSNKRLKTLRNNLIFVQSEIESLFYTDGSVQASYGNHLEEIEFILENYHHFVSDLGMCYRIDKKILSKLVFYQQYTSNMKYSH